MSEIQYVLLLTIGTLLAFGAVAFWLLALEFYRTYSKFVQAQESWLRTSEDSLREGLRSNHYMVAWYIAATQEIRNREEALETCDMKLRQEANRAQHIKAAGPYFGEDE